MQDTTFFSWQSVTQLLIEAQGWVQEYVLVQLTAVQLLVVLLALGLALAIAPRIQALNQKLQMPWAIKTWDVLTSLLRPLLVLLLVLLAVFIANVAGFSAPLLGIVASLLTAWIAIRLVSKLVRQPVLARSIAWVAWAIVALNILQLLQPAIDLLDANSVMLGSIRLSPYFAIRSILVFVALLWLALQISAAVQQRIRVSDSLSPSVKVLLSKTVSVVMVSLAVLIALQSTGIDLTALAVVGGVLGIGVGFGLQKIVGNLVSGVILLLDKSIKPGDVIAVDDSYGWVGALGARYVSVITRDGTEHLIPNEMLITEKVENWTHSNERRRIKVPVCVHYNSDLNQVITLCIEAAQGTERVISDPPAACLLTEFAENAVNLEVRFWINDPHNGIANVKSAVMLKIWNAFHKHAIEIPYPQRDLHIRSRDNSADLPNQTK